MDLGPQYNSLSRFTKDTLQGKQNVANLQYFKSEKDIPKSDLEHYSEPGHEEPYTTQDSYGRTLRGTTYVSGKTNY